MTMPCPDREELAAWLDHEVGERRAEAIQRHVATCSVCTAQTSAIERLIADLRAPARVPASPDAIAAVLARIAAPAPRRAGPGRWLASAGALAAAVAVVLALRPPPGTERARAPGAESGFQARGDGSAGPLERRVGATLYAISAPGTAPAASPRAIALAPDTAVHGDTAFTLGYRNLVRDRALWLLGFAVDAAGEIHWLYPAYTAASDDPVAPRLATSDSEIAMPDSVVLEQPAAGRLRVVIVIAPAPLRVSAIEALRGPELALAALHRRFPGAVISELSLQVMP